MTAALLAGSAHAASCSPSRIADSASALQDSRFALFQLPPRDGGGTILSPEAGHAIADVKTRLAAFIGAYMNCQNVVADPGGIQIDLSRLGWARSPDPAAHDDAGPGKPDPVLSFDVRPFAGGLLGITASFGVPCGSDGLLMLFQMREDRWSNTLVIESAPYRDLSHAYQALDYDISPLDDAGDWFLVEKHVAPACGAATTALTYSVWTPAHAAYKPKPLFTGHAVVPSAAADSITLTVDAGRFDIHYRAADPPSAPQAAASYSVDAHGVVPIMPND